MKLIKKVTFAAVAALAVTLLFQTSITQAADNGQQDEHGQQAKVTFTKWITDFPPCPGVFANMAGVADASSRLPTTTLPPLPAGVTELKFGDFFVQPVGARGLELTETLRRLAGQIRLLTK